MSSFRHKSGVTFVVPDTVYADYVGKASPAADFDASTRSEGLADASSSTVDATDAAPAAKPARKKPTRKPR